MAERNERLSIYLCRLLRHKPEEAGLHMDRHGWVKVDELIRGVNVAGRYRLTWEQLLAIVAGDAKGRYRISDDGRSIKCCQGHSIPWVEPELRYGKPPERLYHGTTWSAWSAIQGTGAITKQSRHAVHTHADPAMAWTSATRWHKAPVLLVIDAAAMERDGFIFGESENHVWCVDCVPVGYVLEALSAPPQNSSETRTGDH